MSTTVTGGLETTIADRGVYASAVKRFRDAGIALPTFDQLAWPERIPAKVVEKLAAVDPDAPHPLNLFRVHWWNDRTRRGRSAVPDHVVAGQASRLVEEERAGQDAGSSGLPSRAASSAGASGSGGRSSLRIRLIRAACSSPRSSSNRSSGTIRAVSARRSRADDRVTRRGVRARGSRSTWGARRRPTRSG